jgi:predicted component of type VI protein secretion system
MASLEVLHPVGHVPVVLDQDRVTIGKSADNDLSIPSDPTLSRNHAVLEPVGGAWVIRDLDSRNGTFVNNEKVFRDHVLRNRDELVLGETRLVFRDAAPKDDTTQKKKPAPRLTPTEREVLVLLCEPWNEGNAFTQPNTVKEIARRRFVTQAAVKNTLGALYLKFDIPENDGDADAGVRRALLANAAWESGVVGPRDYPGDEEDTG